eukprot:CAMPEP_0170471334 /NCGR_PEP_ID=MMETSP0123-20130129/13575_1 /TAXON_ID=182087 /ORGANISM="Favella ehrenbergii, Strain Fehren 1" /LENGTH=62 /DNA_ID=CAMNT_0010738921 /DNA_START=243 /DNA_END=431 /DNA_ORIENTATION=+
MTGDTEDAMIACTVVSIIGDIMIIKCKNCKYMCALKESDDDYKRSVSFEKEHAAAYDDPSHV